MVDEVDKKQEGGAGGGNGDGSRSLVRDERYMGTFDLLDLIAASASGMSFHCANGEEASVDRYGVVNIVSCV